MQDVICEVRQLPRRGVHDDPSSLSDIHQSSFLADMQDVICELHQFPRSEENNRRKQMFFWGRSFYCIYVRYVICKKFISTRK